MKALEGRKIRRTDETDDEKNRSLVAAQLGTRNASKKSDTDARTAGQEGSISIYNLQRKGCFLMVISIFDDCGHVRLNAPDAHVGLNLFCEGENRSLLVL